jgi:hypothetical protein
MAKKDSPRADKGRDEVETASDVRRVDKKIIAKLKAIPSVTSQLRKDSVVSVERSRVPFTV